MHARTTADAERHYSLPSHASLGAALFDHWRLPEPVKQACMTHELCHLEALLEQGNAEEM
jgi:HD-like signal output (HDOD) protein